MSQQISRNRLYIGLFLFIILIVIPYIIGGIQGIFIVLFAASILWAIVVLVNRIWRRSGTNNAQIGSSTLRLAVIAVIMIIIIVVVFVIFLAIAAQNGTWLPSP